MCVRWPVGLNLGVAGHVTVVVGPHLDRHQAATDFVIQKAAQLVEVSREAAAENLTALDRFRNCRNLTAGSAIEAPGFQLAQQGQSLTTACQGLTGEFFD